ncbi:TetR/AcrR family transcriptional regulator [Methylophaga sp.]|uniref:TetR/AcrR family transcriptional regulator n=1 Tax=Methylophaga sp. TaxID=2024840 RepID=UPI00271DB180|nr:TetR/AcrR family transcriptional regulator [Methylophaga sp.]MDO8828117.1 TetR/AcrR family transcriptional regulator [Methylophaga sp.]
MAQKREEMIVETQAKLIKAARESFAQHGFAESCMDDLTADAGLTRGALYHHFGGKKGLLQAVIQQIEEEMTTRLTAVKSESPTTWDGFINGSITYLNMACEPEIQRIILLDGPAVLGDPSQWPRKNCCIRSTQLSIEKLMEEGVLREVDSLAMARLINGALFGASLWIANAEDPHAASRRAVEAFLTLVSGLLKLNTTPVNSSVEHDS